jgi:hypothetical protein
VAEDVQHVGYADARPGRVQKWHVHLVDQLAEERPLGQDLDLEEIRRRLEWDRGQGLAAVQPAGRMHVANRHGEDQSPQERRDPTTE